MEEKRDAFVIMPFSETATVKPKSGQRFMRISLNRLSKNVGTPVNGPSPGPEVSSRASLRSSGLSNRLSRYH